MHAQLRTVHTVLSKSEQALCLTSDDNVSLETVTVTLEDTYKDILPYVNPGDIIVCNIIPGTPNRINGLPFVARKLGDQDNAMGALIRCSRRSEEGKMSLTTRQLHELYKHIIRSCFPRHPEIQTVDEYLTRQAYVYHLCDRGAAVASLLEGYKEPVPLPSAGVADILASWYVQNDVRLLRVLSITDGKGSEIEKSYMPPGEMYSRLLKNPFLVHSISCERARDLAAVIGHVTSDTDVECSAVLNKLSAKTIDSSNVFAPFVEFASHSRMKSNVLEQPAT